MVSDDDYAKLIGMLVILALVLGGVIGIQIVTWKNEAATFNKFKRPDQPAATVWDAAFADLRVTN